LIATVADDERVAALQAFGFTPRQAQFLVLVLEHSGVCLPWQYRTFAGIARGRQTHGFFDKLVRDGRDDEPVGPGARRAELPPAPQAVVSGAGRAASPYWPSDLVDPRALRATLSERQQSTASRMGGR
jgi:hypothetical protein